MEWKMIPSLINFSEWYLSSDVASYFLLLGNEQWKPLLKWEDEILANKEATNVTSNDL